MTNEPTKNDTDPSLEGHDYDGIKELDNPAPFWWQLFFYLSILFSLGYYTYYEWLGGKSSSEELSERMAEVEKLRMRAAGSGPNEEAFLEARKSPERLKLGEAVFVAKCGSCHANDGGGGIGPNLTDAHWLHGQGKLLDVYQVVKAGVLDKGMPPWDALLSKDEMLNVVAYVNSLKGTSPKTPKAPQGEAVPD